MAFDINPVQRTGAIRPQASGIDRSVVHHDQLGTARLDAGVEVEATGDLAADVPPVDAERVDQIRKALEDGTYPVVPTQIADAMIAARLLLSTT